MDRQADLFHVVGAGAAAGGFAGRLHGGEEEADQYPDDGDDDQEFDEGERMTGAGVHGGFLRAMEEVHQMKMDDERHRITPQSLLQQICKNFLGAGFPAVL
jgi:hypothetical protein